MLTNETQISMLKTQAEMLKSRLGAINARIEELMKEEAKE